jgi:hypothetical protein
MAGMASVPQGTRVRTGAPAAECIAHHGANGYCSGMKKPNFWEVDLVELFKLWISDISTFLMTLLMFLGLSLPVVIPSLILWYLWSIDWHP